MEPKIRLAYLVTHPIQYQAPLLRRIAAEPGIDLTVFFCSDFSLKSYLIRLWQNNCLGYPPDRRLPV